MLDKTRTFKCPDCGGSGEIYYEDIRHPDDWVRGSEWRDPCHRCNQTGKIVWEELTSDEQEHLEELNEIQEYEALKKYYY